MTARSIVCPCGTTRSGNEARCPNCGRREGREVRGRALTPRPGAARPEGPPIAAAGGCWMCGLRLQSVPGGELALCPRCDTPPDE